MTRNEARAAFSLAAVFSIRLLGLFMIYPVFAVYAEGLRGATPELIGFALGVYGLSQGLLQIPFGMLSDRVGRKVMVIAGLVLFALGSAVAALATSIEGVILGRVLQGTGAIGAVILALVADLTSEESRTKAMAIIGITIGLSFMVALVAGPVASGWIGVPGIFWLMAGLAVAGMAITAWIVPAPARIARHKDAGTVPALLGTVLRDRELLKLDFGIFALHALLTASFLVVPHLLLDAFALPAEDQWMIYLPVLVASVALMLPVIVVAEKRGLVKPVFVGAVAVLAASQALLYGDGHGLVASLVIIVAFFTAFNLLEATLPSLITKTAPPEAKGTASGVYSSAQFLGIFAGGAGGGWMHQQFGAPGVFAFGAGLALVWVLVAATMTRPGARPTQAGRAEGPDPPAA